MRGSSFCRSTGSRRAVQPYGETLIMISVNKARMVTARRFILLATVANLGVAALVAGPGLIRSGLPAVSMAAAAETSQRPVGFGDLVEKVKPAVISVRVRVEAGTKMVGADGNLPFPPNSQMERFFRRFGMPYGNNTPDDRRQPRDRIVTGQGSGFFI